MGLSSALSIAQSAIANNAAQSAILSKNIANVSNADYSRLSATSISQPYGVSPGETHRATSKALLAALLTAQSSSSSQSALSNGLTSLASTLGLDTTSSTGTTTSSDTSPATVIGAFTTALQDYAAQPDNSSSAASAVQAAKTLVSNLNAASANVGAVRKQADSDLAASVAKINALLAQFKVANDAVVSGTANGTSVSDAQDSRDGILKKLSNEIGISASTSATGSMSIYTDSGVTLFSSTARSVSFTPTSNYVSGTVGQAVMVDGIPVTGSSSLMPVSSGAIAGLSTLRDQSAVNYGNQLDQIASSLISSFAESDQTGGGAPALAGLFTKAGSSSLPTSATGLAAAIQVNARVDPLAGGVSSRLRDGNVSSSDSAYTSNTTGAASYSGRLDQLTQALSTSQTFDSSSGGLSSGTIAAYATSSVSWISAQRQVASTAVNSTSAVTASATTALSNTTGVNLDDQMSGMLDIEHAYQASAQLMNTVNRMYTALLQAFGA